MRGKATLWGRSVVLGLAIFVYTETVDAAETLGAAPEETYMEGIDAVRDDGFFDRIEIAVEADLEYVYEKEGGISTNELTFDEVVLLLGGDWWEAELGIKYETEGSAGLIVEEAALRLGGTEAFPWFIQGGRTVLPFGEYDSMFIEDPLVAAVGETDEDSVIVGYAIEAVEVALGGFRAELPGSEDIELAASAKVTLWEKLRAGVSWSSALGESVEMRDLHKEFLLEATEESVEEGDEADDEDTAEPVGASPASQVQGLGFFVALDLEYFYAQFETVSAVESFPVGHLDDRRLRPLAWNVELVARPVDRWELGVRYEAAHELPGNPRRQYGAAVSFELCEYATLTADYLHGVQERGEPDRQLIAAKLALEY
jgi:hypothetical protein